MNAARINSDVARGSPAQSFVQGMMQTTANLQRAVEQTLPRLRQRSRSKSLERAIKTLEEPRHTVDFQQIFDDSDPNSR